MRGASLGSAFLLLLAGCVAGSSGSAPEHRSCPPGNEVVVEPTPVEASGESAALVLPTGPLPAVAEPSPQLPPIDPVLLGTAVPWERTPRNAFERARAEKRLVLLVQLSGNFASDTET
jgi:hypothetical protein